MCGIFGIATCGTVLGVIIAVVIGMNDYQMSKLAQMRPVYAGDLKDTELDEEEEEFFNE